MEDEAGRATPIGRQEPARASPSCTSSTSRRTVPHRNTRALDPEEPPHSARSFSLASTDRPPRSRETRVSTMRRRSATSATPLAPCSATPSTQDSRKVRAAGGTRALPDDDRQPERRPVPASVRLLVHPRRPFAQRLSVRGRRLVDLREAFALVGLARPRGCRATRRRERQGRSDEHARAANGSGSPASRADGSSQGSSASASGGPPTRWANKVPSARTTIRSLSHSASVRVSSKPPLCSFGNPGGGSGSVGCHGFPLRNSSSSSSSTDGPASWATARGVIEVASTPSRSRPFQ